MKIGNLEKTYHDCSASGFLREKTAVDYRLIASLKTHAEERLSFIKGMAKSLRSDSSAWTFVFCDHYESLRMLMEAFLLFDRIEAEKHQCKNACLCFRHPELGLDWEFLETVRLRRNAINYKGKFLSYEDWKRLEPGLEMHVVKLRQEIERKLSQR